MTRQPSCRALAVAGSWARGDARPGSDLDLIVLTDDLGRWSGDADWAVAAFEDGRFRVTEARLEEHGVARSWRLTLARSVEVEATFVDLAWANVLPIDAGTHRVVTGGFRVRTDKDGRLDALARVAAVRPPAG